MTNRSVPHLTLLGISPHPTFWSMGEGKGVPSFLLAPEGLVRAGHRVVLLMPAGDSPPGRDEYRGIELLRYVGGPPGVLEDAGQGRVLRFLWRVRNYLHYRRAAEREALRLGREIRPDLVIGYDEYAAPVARAVAQELGIPNVSRFFGTYLLLYLHNPVKLYYHFVPAIAYRTAAAGWIVTDDGSGGDEVARRLGAPPDRIRYWRNGVDRALFREDRESNRAVRERLCEQLGIAQGARLLLTMSRFVREKHVERIVRALSDVLPIHPAICLLVLGDGPERDRIEREIRTRNLGHAVRLLGAVVRAELPDYLNSSDLFVAASDRTNASNPTFEAMICALPVVLLDTGRTRELVEDGVSGFLVPEAEPERLGETLVRVLDDGARAREVGLRAREWALTHLPTPEERQRQEVRWIEELARVAPG